MIREWVQRRAGWLLGTTTVRSPAAARTAPPELRALLPLVWPEGPHGPVDADGVRSLARDYARSGRDLAELMDDLDILCSVVGISPSSRLIEASSVSWSDAFLDTVASDDSPRSRSRDEAEALAEVERRLLGSTARGWGGVAPEVVMLVVDWSARGGGDPPSQAEVEEVDRVVILVRSLFRVGTVAGQASRKRVVAAVGAGPDLGALVRTLEARCTELVLSGTVPVVTVVPASTDAEAARHLLRGTG